MTVCGHGTHHQHAHVSVDEDAPQTAPARGAEGRGVDRALASLDHMRRCALEFSTTIDVMIANLKNTLFAMCGDRRTLSNGILVVPLQI